MRPGGKALCSTVFVPAIALPLKDEHDNAFGSLTICSAQPNAFTPEEIRLLEELAGDLAFGIVTLRSRAARKRAEEALRESETRFRTFVDHAGDALFVYDLEERTIVDVNRQACESLGYTRQELIGKTPGAFHLESYQRRWNLSPSVRRRVRPCSTPTPIGERTGRRSLSKSTPA